MAKDHNPFDIHGQTARRKESEDERRARRVAEGEDLRRVMSTASGRRFVWGQLERAGVFRSSFTGNSETFFREGQRNIGLMLLADVNEFCPEQYLTMLMESKEHGS